MARPLADVVEAEATRLVVGAVFVAARTVRRDSTVVPAPDGADSPRAAATRSVATRPAPPILDDLAPTPSRTLSASPPPSSAPDAVVTTSAGIKASAVPITTGGDGGRTGRSPSLATAVEARSSAFVLEVSRPTAQAERTRARRRGRRAKRPKRRSVSGESVMANPGITLSIEGTREAAAELPACVKCPEDAGRVPT